LPAASKLATLEDVGAVRERVVQAARHYRRRERLPDRLRKRPGQRIRVTALDVTTSTPAGFRKSEMSMSVASPPSATMVSEIASWTANLERLVLILTAQ